MKQPILPLKQTSSEEKKSGRISSSASAWSQHGPSKDHEFRQDRFIGNFIKFLDAIAIDSKEKRLEYRGHCHGASMLWLTLVDDEEQEQELLQLFKQFSQKVCSKQEIEKFKNSLTQEKITQIQNKIAKMQKLQDIHIKNFSITGRMIEAESKEEKEDHEQKTPINLTGFEIFQHANYFYYVSDFAKQLQEYAQLAKVTPSGRPIKLYVGCSDERAHALAMVIDSHGKYIGFDPNRGRKSFSTPQEAAKWLCDGLKFTLSEKLSMRPLQIVTAVVDQLHESYKPHSDFKAGMDLTANIAWDKNTKISLGFRNSLQGMCKQFKLGFHSIFDTAACLYSTIEEYKRTEEYQANKSLHDDLNKIASAAKSLLPEDSHLKLLSHVLEKNADLRNRDDQTILINIIRSDIPDEVQFAWLLKNKPQLINAADVKIPCWTALHYCSYYGEEKHASLLIEAGASLNIQDSDGKTPLMCAIISGHDEIAIALIRAGANVNLQNREKNSATLLAARKGNMRVLKALLDAGADPNIKNKSIPSLVCVAAQQGDDKLLQELLDKKVEHRISNQFGNTLHNAAQSGNVKCVQILLAAGGLDPFYKTEMVGTPLAQAALYGHTDIAELFLSLPEYKSIEHKERSINEAIEFLHGKLIESDKELANAEKNLKAAQEKQEVSQKAKPDQKKDQPTNDPEIIRLTEICENLHTKKERAERGLGLLIKHAEELQPKILLTKQSGDTVINSMLFRHHLRTSSKGKDTLLVNDIVLHTHNPAI